MNAILTPQAVNAAAAPPSGCELADIFREYGEVYRQTHRLTRSQRKGFGRRAPTASARAICRRDRPQNT